MRISTRFIFAILMSFGLFFGSIASATSVRQMTLAELSQHADKIFRGKVVSITDGTVAAGGGQLPTVTYRIVVEDVIRGQFPVEKNVRYADVMMLGKPTSYKVTGPSNRVFSIIGLPRVQLGKTYLFMTTRPSSIGLSTTVGLGQGIFLITRIGKNEMAANELNNLGLFFKLAMSQAKVRSTTAAPASGPMPYLELKQQIRSIIGQ
jgi:hypothetical protein